MIRRLFFPDTILISFLCINAGGRYVYKTFHTILMTKTRHHVRTFHIGSVKILPFSPYGRQSAAMNHIGNTPEKVPAASVRKIGLAEPGPQCFQMSSFFRISPHGQHMILSRQALYHVFSQKSRGTRHKNRFLSCVLIRLHPAFPHTDSFASVCIHTHAILPVSRIRRKHVSASSICTSSSSRRRFSFH